MRERHRSGPSTAQSRIVATDLPEPQGRPIEVHVDIAVRGLGTHACGPDTADAFRIQAGSYSLSWWIVPVGPG